MKTTIKVNREDIRQVEAEEQYNFVREVLKCINLPLEECYPASGLFEDFTLEYKLKLRQVLSSFGVIILDDRDGGIEIYIDKPPIRNHLVAKWNKCTFELREDLSTINPRNRIYAVIYIDYWSEYEKE